MNQLPVSRHIKVDVTLTPAAAQAQDLSTLLVLGGSNVIDVQERYRIYETLDEVAADFGNNMPEYLAAVLWFEQSPQPARLIVGRWAQTSTSGVLKGAPLTAAQQTLANFTAVTSGGFTYSKNGAGPTNVTGINLSSATNLNGVASLITAALTGAVCTWNASYGRFELASTTTGASSTVSFLTAPGSGTDISGLLGMTALSSGAYTVAGLGAESALTAVQLFDANYGQMWYGVLICGAANQDVLDVAAYIEGTNTKHIQGATTQEAGVMVPSTTTDLAYQLKQKGYKRAFTQYSSSSLYAVASALAKGLTVDYGGNNTTLTLMYKQEPGIVPESLNSNQASAIDGKNCNYVAQYNNDTAILERGVMANGTFFDVVTGTDWLAVTIQTALFNLLYQSDTKIPQTDAGVNQIVTKIEEVCGQAVENGLVAPGVWDSGGFGLLKQGDYLPKGYYIWAQRVSDQNASDRAARKCPSIRVAVKLAGAIHDIDVAVAANL